MNGISNEENRRFEELVGSLQDIDKKVEKRHANKRHYLIILSSVAVSLGLAIMIFAVTVQQPIVGVVGFVATTLSLNVIFERFLK